MFKWKKRGQIWQPSMDNTWMQEFGQNANAMVLDDRLRIYFSSRRRSPSDGKYISYIFFIDVDKKDPTRILAVHDRPLLNPEGTCTPGSFDEFGTMPGSIVVREDSGEVWLYYVGWSRPASRPYQWANGLAISRDSGVTFEKISESPIMASAYSYPYLHACPRVFRNPDGQWSMWYAGGVEWYAKNGQPNPIYVIKHATSADGISWHSVDGQTIPSVRTKECQSSASPIRYGDLHHMFFSYRDVIPQRPEDAQYRVGYAWSRDLVSWHRDDSQAGIDVSASGWDSEAVCYPHVVPVSGRLLMFYSGNTFGRSGFGYAELEG